MATVTTLRPTSTVSASGWSVTGSASAWQATSDDSDSSYVAWSGSGSPLILGVPAHSPPSDHRRHAARVRMRGSHGNVWWAARTAAGILIGNSAATFGASASTVNGSWDFGLPPDAGTQLGVYVAGQNTGLRAVELYLDVDFREAPTFTPQVLDGTTPTTSVTGTVSPTVRVSGLDLDDLPARQYRFWITDSGSETVWDTGIVAGTPQPRTVSPLPDDSYELHMIVWSTIGQTHEYASDEETLAFTVAVSALPQPDPPTVTPAAESPFFRIDTCAPDMTDFDGDQGYMEVQRVDCHGATATVALLGPLVSDECTHYDDWSMPRVDPAEPCPDSDGEPCCSAYRVRTVGLVSGLLQVSAWSDAGDPDEFCLAWNPTEHLIRSDSPAGPVWSAVCGTFEWETSRPHGTAVGVNGTPMAASGIAGKRNYTMTTTVRSQADLDALRAILRRPLVLVSPLDGGEVWAAPLAETVEVVKVGRVRRLTVQFAGTGPEPSPDPVDILGGES